MTCWLVCECNAMLTLTDSAAFEKYNATKEPKTASIFNVANLLFYSTAMQYVHFVSPTIKTIDNEWFIKAADK